MELFKGQSLLEFTERFKTDKEEGNKVEAIIHGFNNKCFQRWYHRVGKQDYNGGDDIQDRADAQRLFEIWEELEKPNVK